jgi:DNA-binding CsgD family transcriptional regulator
MFRDLGCSAHTTFVVSSGSMPRISESGYRGMLEVLHEAGDIDGPLPFPEPVLDALRRLVPCDVVTYHERLGSRDIVVWTGEPRGEMTPEVREASRRYWNANPLTPAEGARLYSDFLSPREFHRTGLYHELARPLGVEDMVRLWLDPGGAGRARLEFDRPDWGFRESDRAVLDLLLPHLKQFRRNAIARRRPLSSPSKRAEGLSPREREILELVAQGLTNAQVARMLWISPGTVRKHLENSYEKLDVHTRTGAVAALFGSAHTSAGKAFPQRT